MDIIKSLAISVGIIIDRRQREQELHVAIKSLQEALSEIRTLQGFIPICSYCHSIRNDEGAWSRLEEYISKHTNAIFSHGVCPPCLKKVRSEAGLDDE